MKRRVQSQEPKPLINVRGSRRQRVTSLKPDKRKEILALFDLTKGDYDYVAYRAGVQRGDVLAIVLADTRQRTGGGGGSQIRVAA